VAAANGFSRIGTIDGNYGLNRGLASDLLVVAIVGPTENYRNWVYSLGLSLAAKVALCRRITFDATTDERCLSSFCSCRCPTARNPKAQ
jgi:hypothetical protein